MQSHGTSAPCCARRGGPDVAAALARRRCYMAAVLPLTRQQEAAAGAGTATVLTGTVTDVSPHFLVLACEDGERRLALSAGTAVWHGGRVDVTTLGTGEPVMVRLLAGRRDVAERVWARIGRVTGTVLAQSRGQLTVDTGSARPPQAVVISPRAATRIRVRFPTLGPGNLIDVIGLREQGALRAVLPATSQPAYLASRVTRPPSAAGGSGQEFSGAATWHEPAGPAEEAEGVAYPAIDPAGGCAEWDTPGAAGTALPYLSVGSLLSVRNDCTGATAVLPVTGCGTVARLFHDRCLGCGPSPRGRVADLTLVSFTALGGNPEQGCFNATIMVGRRR